MLSGRNVGVILEKTDLEFENQAVLNPGCVEKDGFVHMFYRAVRRGNFSTIGYCRLKDNKVVYRAASPILFPEHEYEKQGVEDPRVVFLEGVYYLFYTAYDGKNALTAYATSSDLVHFEKKGLLSYKLAYAKTKEYFQDLRLSQRYLSFEAPFKQDRGEDVLLWQKDTFLFPKKIGNKYGLIHRILPGVQIIYFEDFDELNDERWIEHFKILKSAIVLDPEYEFENYYIGGGCPPIETSEGWLLIYHAVQKTDNGKIYRAGAALLDLDNPIKVIGRLREPLFSPIEPWEKEGDTPNVVFPTGAIVKGQEIDIYYGAADKVVAVRSFILNDLLTELKNNPLRE